MAFYRKQSMKNDFNLGSLFGIALAMVVAIVCVYLFATRVPESKQPQVALDYMCWYVAVLGALALTIVFSGDKPSK